MEECLSEDGIKSFKKIGTTLIVLLLIIGVFSDILLATNNISNFPSLCSIAFPLIGLAVYLLILYLIDRYKKPIDTTIISDTTYSLLDPDPDPELV